MDLADNWNDVIKGNVKWPFEEFQEIYSWYGNLHDKPRDDWDLKKRGLTLIDEEDEKEYDITFNPFMPMNQLGFHMVKKFGEEKFMHYMHRFMEIMRFISEHKKKFIEDGFMKTPDEDKKYIEIQTEILQALCELPYTQKVKAEGNTFYRLNYTDVINKAKELMEK